LVPAGGVGRTGEVGAEFTQEQAVVAMAPAEEGTQGGEKGAYQAHIELLVERQQEWSKATSRASRAALS
jgi:hypothetical protein